MDARKANHRRRGTLAVAIAAAVAAVVVPTFATAHIERASYWPDPSGVKLGGIQAGGKVPRARGLFSTLNRKAPGQTRVVCQGKVPKAKLKGGNGSPGNPALGKRLKRQIGRNKSIRRVRKSIKRARKKGFETRPSQRRQRLGEKRAEKLRRLNDRLVRHCRYHSIQEAVNDSGNNDRVVVMPGVYTEPRSRSRPTDDPACAGLRQVNDKSNVNALSYDYQLQCPNDQNLIAVIGRASGGGRDPQPPLLNRNGIPNLGRCIRCNLQIEGSGVSADDVVVDAGNRGSGNHGPANAVKDVVIRADRADGFVARNLTVRHAKEHGFYVIETDGYRLEQFKTFYNDEYGVLTFVSDHGLMQECDAAGSGDAGLYPGATPETGEQTGQGSRRYNTEIRRCDTHHNTAGYSGTDGNAVHFHRNHSYDNANGFSTDVFTAAGHPGFPQDGDLIENNRFYSNNFNPYLPGSDVTPTIPMPVGTGLWIAGGNGNVVRNNHFFDNWRRGTMLFSVPDVFVCSDPREQVPGCNPGQVSTSFRNQFYGNTMGRSPKGKMRPNGLDFWWDQQGTTASPNNTGDCWFNNTGRDRTAASITSVPPSSGPAAIPPNKLPDDCNASFAPAGGPAQVAELLACVTAPQGDASRCDWFATPPRP